MNCYGTDRSQRISSRVKNCSEERCLSNTPKNCSLQAVAAFVVESVHPVPAHRTLGHCKRYNRRYYERLGLRVVGGGTAHASCAAPRSRRSKPCRSGSFASAPRQKNAGAHSGVVSKRKVMVRSTITEITPSLPVIRPESHQGLVAGYER